MVSLCKWAIFSHFMHLYAHLHNPKRACAWILRIGSVAALRAEGHNRSVDGVSQV